MGAAFLEEELHHPANLRLNAITIWSCADQFLEFLQTFVSPVPDDQNYRAAGGAQQSLVLQSQKVHKVLLGVVVHEDQVESTAGPWSRFQKRAKCRDGLA